MISLILFINLITSDDFVNVNVLVFYSPLHRQSQSQQTLQLHPWQAYPEPFSTPQGVFSLEHGVTRRGLRIQTSTITEVVLVPTTYYT